MNESCESTQLNLSAIVDGEWPPDTAALLDSLEHLAACAACAAYLKRARDLEAAIDGALRHPVLSEEDHARLWSGVAAAVAPGRPARGAWSSRLAAGLLLAVLGTGAWWALRPNNPASLPQTDIGVPTGERPRPARTFVSEYSSSEGGEVSEGRSAAAEFGEALAPLLRTGD